MSLAQGGEAVQRLEFTGTGSAYFRIWSVNLALTLLTFGIYSAWAKVRRLQYFYRNTSIAGASFDFHGDPLAILKGRVIAVALLAAYNLAGKFSGALGLAALAMLLGVYPWLIQRSLRFKLHYTSWRALRFRFVGEVGPAYQAFLLWPLLGYVTLGILMPVAHREIKRYQHGNSRFGDASFSFDAGTAAFFRIYLKAIGMVFLAIIAAAVLFAALGGAVALAQAGADLRAKATMIGTMFALALGFYVLLVLAIGPWFSARVQNLVWSHTALGPHRFRSDARARDLFLIYLSNFLGIVLTLGLYKPFADIRLARYRLSRIALAVHGDLDAFIAEREQGIGAAGEEAADLFDVDISF